MNKKKSPKFLKKWIWHTFLKTALIPLILVEFVFLCIYFIVNSWTQIEINQFLRKDVEERLTQISEFESSNIEKQLSSIAYITDLYARQTKEALNTQTEFSKEDSDRLRYSTNGSFYTSKDSDKDGAAVFYSGFYLVGMQEENKVARILKTQKLMKDIQNSNPLIASIYLNTFDSLCVIYPYFDVDKIYTPNIDISKFNFYYEADAVHNPERTTKWTDVYLDPAGHGWMASSIAPVYNGNFLEGVVGIDITIDTIVQDIIKIKIPWEGYGLLVAKDGTILALPEKGEDDWGIKELSQYHYSEAVKQDTFKPEEFNLSKFTFSKTLKKELENNPQGLNNIILNNEIKIASWHDIGSTDWQLIIIVPEKNVYAKANDMKQNLLMVGYIMIAGLITFYIIFFFILYRRARRLSNDISQPLLAMKGIVNSIGTGEYYQQEPYFDVKELQETTHELILMGAQLGKTNEDLYSVQEKFEKNETFLQALIDAIDDVILIFDENGTISDIRSNNPEYLAVEYKPGKNRTKNPFKNLSVDSYLNAARKGIETIIEFQIETTKGLRWFQARLAYIKGTAGSIAASARDITERKGMERSVIMARDEAEKANMAKSKFLSNMSHELRTPLNAILGFVQILEMNLQTQLTVDQRKYIKEIKNAGKHLLNLIDDVLDLSQIQTGRMILKIEPVSVALIIKETLELINPIAVKNRITINCRSNDCDYLFVKADKTKLKQVLLNLLSNAIKYNKDNGAIEYYCECIENCIIFHIADTGNGMPAELLDKIFEPFYRYNIGENNVEGTGIGLTMVKELIKMMEGKVHVESNENMGSHFCVELPLSEI